MVGIRPSTIFRMLQPLRNERFDNGVVGGLPHSFLISFASYSPWLTDQDFIKDDSEAGRHSLVDVYRRYALAQLVRQTAKVPGDILEVGVYRGGTGCLMALTASRIGSKATVFLCDTYEGVVKAGVNDPGWKNGEFRNSSVEIVEELIKSTGVVNAKILCGTFPEQTGAELADRKFSLCHIDVDVYQSAKDVYEWVWPKLSVGGVVVFDDYGFRGTPGVTKVVDSSAALPDRVVIYNLNGQAFVVKTA
jgi:O-methyltransferase